MKIMTDYGFIRNELFNYYYMWWFDDEWFDDNDDAH
jgi:hypothetical protein